MAKDNYSMPQSTAGLIRYFDEEDESIKFKPEYIVAFCIGIIALEIVLKHLMVF
jgi:preprotein translocase subunit Sec61beta